MFRRLILIGVLCYAYDCLAKEADSIYQIDMILFIHHASSENKEENTTLPFIEANPTKTIQLKRNETDDSQQPYHLLPSSASTLYKELRALKHHANYQIIGHYTWLQSKHHQQAVSLPDTTDPTWQVTGSMSIKQNTYYQLNTEFIFSNPQSHSPPFLFSHNQRLKNNLVYYLDHPQAGMLIKVHQVA